MREETNKRVKAALEGHLAPSDLTDEEHEIWADVFMQQMANPTPAEGAFFAERRRKGLGVGHDEGGSFVHASNQ
ncbi:hypothetical protein [Ruegeria atlantica]|uniref:Uncharacterized protein n=1 Tax=Ruegeria atlantica TaxID=81569 RepID=A0A0N7LPF9_9RHOB|nr:hypothetical protein [Ruegeria atlantica]CUH45108.1 hypothetical protein RUM4293_04018 [Ruegeria atlantica]